MESLLGPRRKKGEELTQHHKDIAASMQARYEEVLSNMLHWLHAKTGTEQLCLVGGCGMNSVANGKIFEMSPFREVYVPPQPGDAGGAIGAAAYTYSSIGKQACVPNPQHAYLGPSFDDTTIEKSYPRA